MARAFNGTNQTLQSAGTLPGLSAAPRIAVSHWFYKTSLTGNDSIPLELSANSNSNVGSFKVIANDSGTNTYWADCFRTVKSDGHGTAPSNATWHHILINYDFSVASNEVDSIYIDGAAVTLTRTSNGNNSGNFGNFTLYVMSRAATSLWCEGRMADLCIWAPSTVISSTDAATLAAGARASTIRNSEIAYYWPLQGTVSPEPASIGSTGLTVTGATFVADPPTLAPIGGAITARPALVVNRAALIRSSVF